MKEQSLNTHNVAEVPEPGPIEIGDVGIVESGVASDVTRGSGGRHGEASYVRP